MLAGNNYFIAHDSVGQEFRLSSDGQFFCFQRHQLRSHMHPAGSLAGARTSKTASHICTPYELRWLERLGGAWSSLSPCRVSHPEEPLSPHGLSRQQESWNFSQGSWLPRGWNGSCKASRLRPRGHTVSLLLRSIDQSKTQG